MQTRSYQQTLYPLPWSRDYWRCAAREWSSVRALALAALFIALRVVLSSFFIPLPVGVGTQKIFFTFFVNALGSYLYGPLVGLAAGGISDIVGVLIHPTGPFFPGYTLTSMAGSFLYGLFLYRARITVLRLTLCKLSVNLLVNVVLNGLWDSILAGKGFWALTVIRLPKNLIALPVEVLLMVLFFNLMLPITERLNWAPAQPKRPIPWK